MRSVINIILSQYSRKPTLVFILEAVLFFAFYYLINLIQFIIAAYLGLSFDVILFVLAPTAIFLLPPLAAFFLLLLDKLWQAAGVYYLLGWSDNSISNKIKKFTSYDKEDC